MGVAATIVAAFILWVAERAASIYSLETRLEAERAARLQDRVDIIEAFDYHERVWHIPPGAQPQE